MRVRTSIGNRILSVLLAACMVFGMIPLSIFSVSAAASDDATTQSSVDAIRSYASNLLNSNFGKAASEDSSSTSDKFTWDTEGKKTNWRYYNGVMLDALLMLGVDSNAGNALEFAKDFLDTNTENSDSKAVTHFITKEVDSVPPALVLFDLLDTAEVSESDRAIYVKAINYVYKQMEAQTKYSNCGGNLLHKDSWDDYQIGLDGIYMAQPFYMEYAAALEAGKITNTVNDKEASDIYKEVYDRLMWVAEYMYDEEDTGLYHHGWSVDNSKGNGHFWSRGIGWYAAGLVMCIDLMPAGQYKEDLIDAAEKLFDGMLPYQDKDTGLWYNVVNRDDSLTANNGNKLETSGSALMAYAMIKAYNEDWVAKSYATAGLEAFNGIIANKLKSGKITDIYKSSGVGTNDDYYCSNDYVSDEAKGVGPVIMAAAEAAKYLGGDETFTTGVVVAPSDMTIAAGATSIDTSNIKVSLLGGQGSIANGVASQMTYEVGAASNGKATVTVKNGTATIGTFQVNVIDPSTPAEGEGTLGIETESGETPSAPSVTAGNWTEISAGGSSDGFYYRVGSTSDVNTTDNYVICQKSDGTGKTAISATADGEFSSFKVTTNVKSGSNYNLSPDGTVTHWKFDSEGRLYTVNSGGTWYVQFTKANDSDAKQLTNNASDATKFTVSSANQLTATVNETKCYVKIDSSGFCPSTSSQSLYIFGQAPSGDPKYGMLSGTATYAYPVGTSADILAAIKNDYAVYTNTTNSGNGTSVAWTDSSVSTSWNKTLDTSKADTYTLSVKLDGKEIGKIPVLIYGNTVITNYDVDLSVTPGAIVAAEGDAAKQLNHTVIVSELSGYGSTVKYSGGSSSVATVTEDGLVTIVGEGSTTITATVTAITYDGKTYTSADFGSITATIPVVVNAEPVEVEVTYSITGLTVLPSSVTAGDSAQATATAAASDGSGNHSYTFHYSISGSGVSINSTTGAITTTASASGTYTVTATLGQVDGQGDFNAGTVTKTATFTVVEAEEPTETTAATEPSEPSATVIYEAENGTKATGVTTSGSTNTKFADLTINGQSFTKALKIDSGGTLTYVAQTNGVLTFYVGTQTADRKVQVTQGDTKVASHTISEANVAQSFTVTVEAGKTYVFSQESGETCLYMATFSTTAGDDHTHSYTSSVTTQPGCETTGVRTYTCSCGDSYTETIAATGHSWGSGTVTTEPGCETTGVRTYICANDESHTKTETIAATGHNWGSGTVTTEPGCETTGVRTYICANDGSHTKTETIAATGHNYVDGTCSNCGAEDPNAGTAVDTNVFKPVTSVTSGKKYVIAAGAITSASNTLSHTNDSAINSSWTETSNDGEYTPSVSVDSWIIESTGTSGKYYIYYMDGTSKVYLMANGSSDVAVTANPDSPTVWTINTNGSGVTIAGGSDSKQLQIESGGNYKLTSSKTVYLYEMVTSTSGGETPDVANPSSLAVTSDKTITVANGGTLDLSGVTATVTMSDGSTKTATGLTFEHSVNTSVAGDYTVTVKYTENGVTVSDTITVTVEAAAGSGVQYVLDTDGIDDGAEYLIVDLYNGKYYALGHSGTGERSYVVTINGNIATIDEANAATALWTFTKNSGNSYYISNDGVYIKTGSSTVVGSSKTSVDAIAYNLANGEYRIDLDSGSGIRDLTANSTSGWDRGSTSNTYPILLFKKVGGGAVVVTPSSATVSPSTVNVANSGTVDLSSVTMEVTMSDGSKKTIQNANLTYDVSGINTAIAGTYTVPVSYTENGKTVTANVSVVVAEASSGTTTSDLWKHNFTVDGDTDADKWYNISANYTDSYSGSYGDLDFDRAMKMESSTKVTFTAPNAGTFTLVFDTKDSTGHSVYLTDPDGKKTSYTVPSDGVLTIDLAEGGEYLLQKNSGSSYVFYMEYASAVTDGIQVTNPGTLYIAGSAGVLNPTHELQYTVKHGGEQITSGYTIEWSVLDSSVATVNSSGVITGWKPGTTSVTAKVTMSDGTEYTATVPVTVAGPSVNATEEMALIFGESGSDSATISATVLAGGSTVSSGNFTLGYKSADENIAFVDTNGNVTAKGAGTVTIYTYIKTVNGHTVYSGDGTTPQPPYFDSTVVTVTKKEVTNATLNSYDYIIEQSNDEQNLIDALTYKDSVTDEGGVTAEEGLILTVEFNTGEKRVLHYGDPGLTVDWSGVVFSDTSVQTALVTYVDPTTGEELFRDTIWVHIERFDPSEYDGVITLEEGIHYVLDNDGINENEEYVIVADNGETALKNPSATATGSTGASGAAVTLANGVLASKIGSGNLFGGAAVDYLTIAKSEEQQAAWLLDTFVANVTCPDGVVRTQINASNLNRYLGSGDSETQLIHANADHVYLEAVSVADGEYRIVLGFGDNNAPYYLGYVDGVWTATTEASSVFMYNKHVEMTDDYGIDYSLNPNTLGIPEGFVSEPIIPSVVFNEDTNVPAGEYTIVWSSSNPSVATVDQNGVVTGVKAGTAEIYATLYDVYGMAVVCTTHNVPYITKTVNVTVSSSEATPILTPDELTIGAGSMPNLSKVNIVMTYVGSDGSHDYAVPYDQLNFKLADATGVADDGTQMDRFDNMTPGTYQVPVTYAGDTYTLTIKVVEDPYAGLDEADSIPGYPDAGSVRMNKTAKGVLDFSQTGVTKLELTAAGVSTKNSVDVVLIVDVSNSMGWSLDWFVGKTDDEVSKADDYDKGPAGGASGTDKLDMAMQTADHFADILLNVDGGDNTLTFVTFAGADRQHGGSSDHVDSVRTPMVGISDYDIAAKVFADTKFTNVRYLKDGEDTGKYELTIGGYDDDGYGEASVSGANRGNTNYDFAFGEAIDAVAQLKAKYNATHEDTYEESGRQIHVVFMTDGAPSHYNSKNANGSADTLWSGSGKYSKPDGVSESSWLTYIENYNELATQLYPMIDGAYTVGFDMAHGGFSTYSYSLDEMERVLEGLAKNTVVPVEMAENEEDLDDYLTTLARALAYAGTNAQVTDVIGGSFSLFTGVSMYSSDITAGGIMSAETLAAMQAMSFPITVNSYTLVTVSDLDKTMSVILNDGSTATVTVKEEHLGLRVNEAPEVLEEITFSADGTEAYSNLKDGNIMTINAKGERVIEAETFTYTATLDTVIHEGVETVHAKDETIQWKIGTITDKEVAMEYYAYLDGALDNPREAVAGVYPTNEYAYAEYIDVYGKYVKRYYGVPQIAWGAGNVTVRFFLVNANGQYVNRAGVPFTNPANRIFLDGRAQYEAELNNHVSFTALDALTQAGLAGNNVLYDVTAGATVTNSTTANQGGVTWVKNESLNNINNLLTYTDSSNGFYTSVVIDIPVVMTDLGESLRPLSGETVVIDYGKPMDIDLFSAEEKPYVAGYPDVRNPDLDGTKYWFTMEIVGFAPYSSSFDQRDYVMANAFSETLNTKNGSYAVTSANGDTQVRFTPNGIMKGMDQVFVVVAFQEYAAIANGDGTYSKGEINEDGVYYMYKQLNVIPATAVYYETDGNVGGAFTYTGNWTLESGASKGKTQQDVYTAGSTYGYDSSYLGDSTLSNGASQKAAGEGVDKTTATFTFTGTGFDIISRTAADQGAIRVQVKNAAGNVVKTISVINKGENELYQNPVISVDMDSYDTYTVVIGVYPAVSYGFASLDRGNEFYFDAVRIYGTMKGTETISEAAMENGKYTTTTSTVNDVYTADGEVSPVFTEIRDILIDASSFASTGAGAMFMDDFGTGEVNVTNYKDWGANNETYLKAGQSIAFTFDLSAANKAFDIGLRAVDGKSVNAKIAVVVNGTTYEKTVTLNSATAQFYDILATAGFSGTGTIHVVISADSGDGILCLTDLKYNGAAVTSDYQTYLAARMVLSGEYDVYSAVFADDSVRIARTTTMTVVTSTEVESLVIANCYGEEVWFSATSQDVGSQRIWTVKLRPVLQGEQSFTVTGIGADGTTGVSASDSINVKLY